MTIDNPNPTGPPNYTERQFHDPDLDRHDHHGAPDEAEMRAFFQRQTHEDLVHWCVLLWLDTGRLRRELDDAQGVIR